jgi:hypothetical protein
MATSLARRMAGGDPRAADVAAARAALAELGVAGLVARLELAERILRTGSAFHLISRFFVDGSEEQRYLLELEAEGR